MDYNKISACITTVKDDAVKIDDSKFTILDIACNGEEFTETELTTLICSSNN